MQNYNPEDSSSHENLKVLEQAAASPAALAESMADDPEFRAAFNEELRLLAQDIVEHNPSLTQLLLSMSEDNPVQGRN